MSPEVLVFAVFFVTVVDGALCAATICHFRNSEKTLSGWNAMLFSPADRHGFLQTS